MIPYSPASGFTYGCAYAHRMAMRIVGIAMLCCLPMAAIWAAPDRVERADVSEAAGGPPAGVPGNGNAGGNGNGNAGGNGNGNDNAPVANNDPIAVDDYVALAAPTRVTILVLANDSDPDSDTLSITTASVVSGGGTVELVNRNTRIRYTPVVGFVGTAELAYMISDGRGGTASASVFVTIANRPPVATDSTAAVNEDRSINLTLRASDPDRQVMSYTIVSGPTHGTLGPVVGNRIVYTPDADYYGPDALTFVASDGIDDSNVATVAITVRPVNDRPVAVDDTATTTMNTSVVIPVLENDYDIDSPTLTITSARAPGDGTAVISGSDMVYTPRSNWTGIDTFRYTISDGFLSATATVTVTVEAGPIPVVVAFGATEAMWDATPKAIQVQTDPADIAFAVTYDGLPDAPSAPGSYEVVATVTEPGYVGSASTVLTIALGGSGLAAVYHDNLAFSGATVSRIDPVIDFNWGSGSPDPAIGVDTFSVLWTGQVQAATSEIYTFTTTSDDGIRLWVNGTLVIDHWRDQAATDRSGSIALEAGQLYDIAIQYYENGGQAVMRLSWQTPTIARHIVPTGYLFPSPGGVPVPVVGEGTGLAGFYFPTMNLIGTPVLRHDPTIDFNWGNGQPHPAIAADLFSVRWVGYVQAQFTQTYVFTTTSDDGVRLWVDDQLLVDRWVDQSATSASGSIALVAGQIYPIRMEFYERYGQAVARLNWSGPATLPQVIPQSQLYPNVAPVAADDVATTDEDVPVFIDVLANDSDADGDLLSVIAVSAPAHGTAAIVGNLVRYTPATDWFGIDAFTYTISDGYFQATATVTVTVNEVSFPAEVQIGDLAQLWDGTPRAVQVTTDPVGLPVVVTYNGAPDAPLYAGSYLVEASIVHPDYHGSASATLVVAPAVSIAAPAYAIAVREPITVTATINGQLGGSVTWQWVHLAGPGTAALTSADAAAPSVVFDAEGMHTLHVHADVGYATVTASVDLTVARPDVDTGLLAHYAFDEGEGSVAFDATGREQPGRLLPGVTWEAVGKFGGAVRTTGTGYVQVRHAVGTAGYQGPLSVGLWVRADRPFAEMASPAPVLVHHGLFAQNRGFGLLLSQNDGLELGMRLYASPRQETTLVDDTAAAWVHYAGSYDGSYLRLWRNGVLSAERNVGAIPWNPAQIVDSLLIGNGFEGLIDDVRIYGRALDRVDLFGLVQAYPELPAPAVEAGADRLIMFGDALTLAGSAEDRAGAGSLSVAWSQRTGPAAVTFTGSGAQALDPQVIFPSPGTYRLRLVVDDGLHLAWDDVTIVVVSAPSDLDTSLVAFHPFDEGTGTVTTDLSVHGRDGSFLNGQGWRSDGAIGAAIALNGGNRVRIAHNDVHNPQHITVSTWVNLDRRPSAMSAAAPLLVWKANPTTRQGYGLMVTNKAADRFAFRVYDGVSTYREAILDEWVTGGWVHYAASFDGQAIRFYRNGRLVDIVLAPYGAITPSSVPLDVGNGFEGGLDGFRLHGRPLSAEEILEEISIGLPPSSSG